MADLRPGYFTVPLRPAERQPAIAVPADCEVIILADRLVMSGVVSRGVGQMPALCGA